MENITLIILEKTFFINKGSDRVYLVYNGYSIAMFWNNIVYPIHGYYPKNPLAKCSKIWAESMGVKFVC